MNMLEHSCRNTPAVVSATSGKPCTQAYLVSQAWPAQVQALRLTITNRDQGFYSDPNAKASWTWFEVSVARRIDGLPSNQDLRLSASTRPEPSDFTDELRRQGFRRVALQDDAAAGEGSSASVYSLRIRTTEVPCRDWQTWSTTWHPGLDHAPPQNLDIALSKILPGNYLIVWARAQYPAWRNFVKEARLELESPSFQVPNTHLYIPTGSSSSVNSAPNAPNVNQVMQNAVASAIRQFGPLTTARTRDGQPESSGGPSQTPPIPDMVKQLANRALGFIGQSGERLQTLRENQRRQENDREFWKPPRLTPPAVPSFEYDTLNTGGKTELRLLRVVRSDENDQQDLVRCELTTHQGTSLPKYTALSYTWGEIAEDPILLNSRLWHIRANLLAFLLQVQQEPKYVDSYYWIDAVCIDQNNTSERSITVSRMKEIYEKSHDIIIWLGPGKAEIESSFDALDSLTKLHVFNPGGRYAPKEGEDVHARSDLPILIERLLTHPYWHRVWILQEASTPHHMSPSWVWYGNRKRMFFEFVMSLMSLSDQNKKERKHLGVHQSTALERLGFLSMQRNLLSAVQAPPITMMGLLEHARICRCSDDRDRIYALLGVATDMDDFTIDYAKSTATIFAELARHIITKENNLDILSFTDGRRAVADLPSWKRDAEEAKADYLANHKDKATLAAVQVFWKRNKMYNASNGLESQQTWFSSSDMTALTINGFEWDKVVSIDSASIFLDFISHAQEPYEHNTPHNKMEAFMTTACAAVSSSNAMGMHERGIWSQPNLKPFIPDPGTEIQIRMSWRTVLSKAMPGLKETIPNRTLFMTSKGYIGLGSDRIVPGDSLCIASGAQCPQVLRPAKAKKDAYEFFGEAYVHGIMDGQLAAEYDKDKPVLCPMVLV